ncbi:uncharacterized protein SPPG_07011 [Spizellomyces punctatus DAOM BR117]|uniref:K Homology domain-containing protein n=1 Tax=Spizellomyces punctatus (strain DAOM BR117) TaxID=645134 RepID=A0A0L0H957_SPIPD|nr:uncharacterized protein SPPG_07011 [Spizellomyces punctatus DAOM BR117]KNC97536.1 hypothetical protein SPPG_07011 [Spizellomyces punctatus DAOM BR117]|eukprot:XP_016605576.1 hypothetical protein SPPG_07011 [Spizellomyces punctatus DAOM BR117]
MPPTTLTFKFPPELQGLLIGIDGSNIKSLQNQRNISVTLPKTRGVITLSGQADDVKSAQEAILHRLFRKRLRHPMYGFVVQMPKDGKVEFVPINETEAQVQVSNDEDDDGIDESFTATAMGTREDNVAEGFYVLRFLNKDGTSASPTESPDLKNLSFRTPGGAGKQGRPLVELLDASDATSFWSYITHTLCNDIKRSQTAFDGAMTDKTILQAFCLSKTLVFRIQRSLLGQKLSFWEFKSAMAEGSARPFEAVYSPKNVIEPIRERFIQPLGSTVRRSHSKVTLQGWRRYENNAWDKWVHQLAIPLEDDANVLILPCKFFLEAAVNKRRCFIVTPDLPLGLAVQLVIQPAATPIDSPILQNYLADLFNTIWRQPPTTSMPDYRYLPALPPNRWSEVVNIGSGVRNIQHPSANSGRPFAALPFWVRTVDVWEKRTGCESMKIEHNGDNILFMIGMRGRDGTVGEINAGTKKESAKRIQSLIANVLDLFTYKSAYGTEENANKTDET